VTTCLAPNEVRAVGRALAMIERACYRPDADFLRDPGDAKAMAKLRLGALQREEFHAIWLDSQLRFIAAETLFVGTLTQAAVYPREVVKAALAHNAACVIVAHNHPSGALTPSAADWSLTSTLMSALSLVDVTLQDHIIVSGDQALSMRNLGGPIAQWANYATPPMSHTAKPPAKRATKKTA